MRGLKPRTRSLSLGADPAGDEKTSGSNGETLDDEGTFKPSGKTASRDGGDDLQVLKPGVECEDCGAKSKANRLRSGPKGVKTLCSACDQRFSTAKNEGITDDNKFYVQELNKQDYRCSWRPQSYL